MAVSPANFDNEQLLGDFCEACLELLNRGGPSGTVLADMLPSFVSAIRACGAAAGRLDGEFARWESNARRLTRLASLHCAEDADGLVASLETITRDAASAVNSLKSLAAERDAAQEASDRELDPEAVEIQLRTLCNALLSLLNGGPNGSSLLGQTLPSLPGLFAECPPLMLARLRAELHASRTLAEELIPLAVPAFSEATTLLAERLEEAQAVAERLIASLESLAHSGSAASVKTRGTSDGAQDLEEELSGLAGDPLAVNCCRLALASQQQGDLATAETLLDEALRLDPSLRPAWIWRGRIRLLKGDASRAVADETQALNLQGDDARSLGWRADALAMCGRYEEALADYDRALEIEPDCLRTQYNRAVMLRYLGQLDEAWFEFGRLLSHRSNRARVHLNRALICEARGDLDAAIEELRASLAIQPGQESVIACLRKLGVQIDEEPPALKPHPPKPPATHTDPPSAPRPPKRIAKARRAVDSPPGPSTDTVVAAQGLTDFSANPSLPATSSTDTVVAARGLTVVTFPLDDDRDLPASDDLAEDLAYNLLKEPTPASSTDSTSAEIAVETSVAVSEEETTEADLVPESPPPATAPAEPTTAETAIALLTAAARAARPAMAEKAGSNLKIRCPACGASSLMRWGQLNEGKTIMCRHCKARLAVQSDGHLTEVRQNWRGKWSIVGDQSAWWKDWRVPVSAVAVLVVVLGLSIWFRPPNFDEIIAEDPSFPQELEPRAELFAQAWLKGDYKTMRQLTDEQQSQELYVWVMEHPAPKLRSPATLDRDAKFDVRIVDANPPHANVAVEIKGLQIARGRLSSPLKLTWRQDEKRWAFQPVTYTDL